MMVFQPVLLFYRRFFLFGAAHCFGSCFFLNTWTHLFIFGSILISILMVYLHLNFSFCRFLPYIRTSCLWGYDCYMCMYINIYLNIQTPFSTFYIWCVLFSIIIINSFSRSCFHFCIDMYWHIIASI